jgi:hypothetical protein|nr:MAG TPA: hypothetical protein [Bacteriophage sp.]
MKTVTKVSIELTREEYDAIINAQDILSDIANLLDAEGALESYALKIYFDTIDRNITNILNIIEEGIERKDGEQER